MKITGSSVIPATVQQTWDALLDPQVLVSTIPGCSRLELTGENAYAMTVTAGVAAIKGTYDGTCVLSDLVDHQSLVMRLSGAGAPGTVDATVHVSFAAVESGTEISYDADAIVGGMVGGVGQRMLTSVSKRMAGEFFGNVAKAIDSGIAPVAPVAPAGPAASPTPATTGATTNASGSGAAPQTVFTPTKALATTGDHDAFVKGALVGAGLVVLGIVVGRLLGRK